MSKQPKTIAVEVAEKLDEITADGVFLSPADPRVVELMHKLEQLQHADPVSAMVGKAYLLHMTGDLDGALHELNQAPVESPSDRLAVLANYGRCEEAQALFSTIADPRSGQFSKLFGAGIVCGAFHLAARFAKDGRQLGLTNTEGVPLTEELPLETIEQASHLLSEFGFTDHDAGVLMQTASDVLRGNGFMFIGQHPDVEVIDEPGEQRTVHVTYRVLTSPSRATDLYMDFVMEMGRRELQIPNCFHISFLGMAV